MKTHEITTSKGEFVIKDIPADCHVSDISIGTGLNDVAIAYPDGTFEPIGIMPCRIICKISEATEDDAKLIVDENSGGYFDYNIGRYVSYFATHSLHSLLKSKRIDINNGNWYLFKKI